MNPIPKTLWIANGPGRWDLMLSIFDGKEVKLTIGCIDTFVIFRGGYFNTPSAGQKTSDRFNFEIMLPLPGTSSKINVTGVIDLHTRRGKIENPKWAKTTGERVPYADLHNF